MGPKIAFTRLFGLPEQIPAAWTLCPSTFSMFSPSRPRYSSRTHLLHFLEHLSSLAFANVFGLRTAGVIFPASVEATRKITPPFTLLSKRTAFASRLEANAFCTRPPVWFPWKGNRQHSVFLPLFILKLKVAKRPASIGVGRLVPFFRSPAGINPLACGRARPLRRFPPADWK